MHRLLKRLAPMCFAIALLWQPLSAARADVFIRIAPPILPIYSLPAIPGPDYIWSPGYWAYDDDDADYYWVPGTWVLAPRPGLLWTPGYWAYGDGGYYWRAGYWGPHVGFYGGINYGFGYGGYGYDGGRWDNGRFFYNTAVYRVNRTVIQNTYVKNVTVINNTTKVSFNGGNGGTKAKPNAEQEKFAKEEHVERTSVQADHQNSAKSDPSLFVKSNHGKPSIAATSKAGTFSGKGVVSSKGAKAVTSNKTSPSSSSGGPAGTGSGSNDGTSNANASGSTGKRHDGSDAKSHTSVTNKGQASKGSSGAGVDAKSNTGITHKEPHTNTSSTGGGGSSGGAAVHTDHKAGNAAIKSNTGSGSVPHGNSGNPKLSTGANTQLHSANNAGKANVPHTQTQPHNGQPHQGAAHGAQKNEPGNKQP